MRSYNQLAKHVRYSHTLLNLFTNLVTVFRPCLEMELTCKKKANGRSSNINNIRNKTWNITLIETVSKKRVPRLVRVPSTRPSKMSETDKTLRTSICWTTSSSSLFEAIYFSCVSSHLEEEAETEARFSAGFARV